MCFGPAASFTASGVLASIGAVVIKNIRHKREILFAAYFLYNWAFISVWCFFAAVLSLTLYVFLRKLHHQPILLVSIKH